MMISTDIFCNNGDPMPTIRFTPATSDTDYHTLRIENCPYGSVGFNIHTVRLEDLLAFGRAIVGECEKLAPTAKQFVPADRFVPPPKET